MSTTNQKLNNTELAHREVIKVISDLATSLRKGASTGCRFTTARQSLETILLATPQFAVLKCRLTNAENAWLAGESGAANYEVRLVLNQLRTRVHFLRLPGKIPAGRSIGASDTRTAQINRPPRHEDYRDGGLEESFGQSWLEETC